MTMTLARFEDALDRYGFKLSAWPPDLRTEASELLDSDPAAQRAQEEAAQVSCLLAQAMTPTQPTAPQLGRLAQNLETRRRRPSPKRLFSQRELAALLGLGLLVFSAGAWTGTSVAQDLQDVEIAVLDLDAAALGFDP
jgi:anti-sigma factor RsiW